MVKAPTMRCFGTLATGDTVEAWMLVGSGGMQLEAITYGGIVTKLLLARQKEDWLDLTLGFDQLQLYVDGHPYFGAIIGRVAGRIPRAQFTLDGQIYKLPANESPNHLHGGSQGFDKKLWHATPGLNANGEPSLRLSYTSPNGDQGYPGNVKVAVTYTITHDNTFLFESEASTDRATPFSLTHHSYFNLAGEGSGTIADHTLQVCADRCIGTHTDLTLTDSLAPVDETPNDLRQPTRLGGLLPHLAGGNGALYPVPPPATPGELSCIAELKHPASGRVLTCSTNAAYLQIYPASAFDGSIVGKSGAAYPQYAGICLECEDYPNGANRPDLGNIILRPGQAQLRRTAYAFSTQATNDENARQSTARQFTGGETHKPRRH
jgi:aldose 1-epimerase